MDNSDTKQTNILWEDPMVFANAEQLKLGITLPGMKNVAISLACYSCGKCSTTVIEYPCDSEFFMVPNFHCTNCKQRMDTRFE